MTKLILELPVPPEALRPNARKHWKAVAPYKTKAKMDGLCAVREQVAASPFDPTKPLNILYIYYPPAPRGQYLDDDNLIGAMKYYRDGIAAGLQMNDKVFLTHTPRQGPKEGRGRVVVEIWQEGNA